MRPLEGEVHVPGTHDDQDGGAYPGKPRFGGPVIAAEVSAYRPGPARLAEVGAQLGEMVRQVGRRARLPPREVPDQVGPGQAGDEQRGAGQDELPDRMSFRVSFGLRTNAPARTSPRTSSGASAAA